MAKKAKKSEKPPLVFVKEGRGLVPASAYDAEEFDGLPPGTTFELRPVETKGRAQLAFYWSVLKRVVNATGLWPTDNKLHEGIKRQLGYVTLNYMPNGTPYIAVDSIALANMSDEERKVYIAQAWELLATETGIDPVSLLEGSGSP